MITVNRITTLLCSSNSTSAPDYYSKLVILPYTWFVNDTKIKEETRDTLILYVTREFKYNKYSCTATEEGLQSERSDPVQIYPLCKYDWCILFSFFSFDDFVLCIQFYKIVKTNSFTIDRMRWFLSSTITVGCTTALLLKVMLGNIRCRTM